ncbi:MAG TPA: ROK family protein [Cytophagales bacterium]|nr:ROK family protein [Cytophagales bacterium]HAP60486.1 ROK family protein [Cytophagales bacterium]
MENFLGIDVGGTGIKVGLVSKSGDVLSHLKIDTDSLRQGGDFIHNFVDNLEGILADHPDVDRIGMGVPGTLSKDRRTLLELPAIPEFNGVSLGDLLQARFPNKQFRIENDANAAALGEYHFSDRKMPENFIFVTLGTGVGGAAIINRKIFSGGDGNGMEIGHILSRGRKLENNIGKAGMMELALETLRGYQGATDVNEHRMNSHELIRAATQKDGFALEVFDKIAELLGEAMVSTIRILDIKNVYIGGGLSVCFDYIISNMIKTMSKYLTPYYLEDLHINRARLGNEAGVVGAAALCFEESLVHV